MLKIIRIRTAWVSYRAPAMKIPENHACLQAKAEFVERHTTVIFDTLNDDITEHLAKLAKAMDRDGLEVRLIKLCKLSAWHAYNARSSKECIRPTSLHSTS